MTERPTLTGPFAPPKSGGPPRSIVVFLHGYGSNGADLIGLAPYWRDDLPDTLFVAPNAPQVCPGAPGGFQWWPLTSLSPAARAEGVRLSAPALDAFIDGLLAEHEIPASRLALVGFSQGTMMALHVGPRRAEPVAAIVGYSGMLADPEALAAEGRNRPPVLLIHGDADEVLPVASMTRAQTALDALGFAVASHVSHGLGHSVDEAGLARGGDFLSARLA
ncbi:MAG: dienelactone hydrolase family protein [Pseudomonadota bacterium]